MSGRMQWARRVRSALCASLLMTLVTLVTALTLVTSTTSTTSRAHAQDSASSLESILASFREVKALSAHFHEEKQMALLAVPLLSEGELHYARPSTLARHTTKPARASLVLDGEMLYMMDGRQARSLSLDTHPAVRILVDAFVSVLAGDLKRLQAVADVQVSGDATQGWKLALTPTHAEVAKIVRAIEFEGKGARVTRMLLRDANGDTTVTRFSEVRSRAPFDAAERRSLFRHP